MSRVLVTFSVAAKPVPKPGLIPNGHGGVRYPRPAADHYRAFKAMVARAAEAQLPPTWTPAPGGHPIGVRIVLEFKQPKSRAKEKWHTQKPDVENSGSKPILDALTGLVWEDDKQVSAVNQAKVYGAEEDRVTVQVVLLSHQGDDPGWFTGWDE